MVSDIEQYRKILEGDSKAVVKDMIQTPKTVPQNERWTGKVVDTADPDRLGRVRIKIIGYYDNIEDKQLPWAIPDIAWLGGKCGSQIIPEVDSMVRGYFDQGDVQRPVYDSLAFNQYNSESDYTSRQNRADYPHMMVLMETDQGDFLTLNRKDGNLCFTHRTGATTVIDKNGNISIKTGTNMKSWLDVTVNGDCNINVSGNANVYATQNVTVDAGMFVDLGNNPAKQFVNNLTNCPICGILHSTQQKVRA